MRLFISNYIVLEDAIISGGVAVDENGKIAGVVGKEQLADPKYNTAEKFDVGDNHIMAGIIDSHVHVNEPGRTDWEGFETATKAAAAGGITTIADMPLNSIPPTTSLENLNVKLKAATGKVHVDVGFWGGVVPGNQNELTRMIGAGVVGFKCFLCPSGVDEFQYVKHEDVELAMKVLDGTDALLAFHAERECNVSTPNEDPKKYETFLKSKPDDMEVQAIRSIIKLGQKYRVRTHIVHLSTAQAVPLIAEAKSKNANLSVETCHHYLNLASETIPDSSTQFKCCPPIRCAENKELLWKALKSGVVDMVVSDHSPSTPDLKLLCANQDNAGDFIKAWGGISSLQFGLSLFWSAAKSRGFTILDINKYMSRATATLLRLHNNKGRIAKNYDADLVVWDPHRSFCVEENMIRHRNKATPYMGWTLQGKVLKTILRGEIVYDGSGFAAPKGQLLFYCK